MVVAFVVVLCAPAPAAVAVAVALVVADRAVAEDGRGTDAREADCGRAFPALADRAVLVLNAVAGVAAVAAEGVLGAVCV